MSWNSYMCHARLAKICHPLFHKKLQRTVFEATGFISLVDTYDLPFFFCVFQIRQIMFAVRSYN